MVIDMSKGPLRTALDICGDCSAPDPKWASVNRGVLICDDCCSIHRTLGRHISQVKSLKKGSWPPTLLACVKQLVSSGANNIWEYNLVDATLGKQLKRKPNPRDPLHPTKAEFIRAKYQLLAFMKKYRDDENGTITDLSKQLHSSVRSGNLETSLRLLSYGADPNFLHPDRGSKPLHVAAQSGQVLQAELLIIYGADPGSIDNLGKSPADYARNSHPVIAQRLIECQYELTDTLAYYLCSRKPDHRNGQHYIIPENVSMDITELAKAAKRKLQALDHNLFEELAMDVFDEVDRRVNDSDWNALNHSASRHADYPSVPFLPMNPDFSSTRNQGRQKLAKFNATEFATLIIDILNDAKRRQQAMSSAAYDKERRQSVEDNDYDTVASEEDYAFLGEAAGVNKVDHQHQSSVVRAVSSALPNSPIRESTPSDVFDNPLDECELRMALDNYKHQITELIRANKRLEKEVASLQQTVKVLAQENSELKSRSSSSPVTTVDNKPTSIIHTEVDKNMATAAGNVPSTSTASQQRPSLPAKDHPFTNGHSSLYSRSNSTNAKPLVAPSNVNLRNVLAAGRNRPKSMVEPSTRLTAIPIEIGSNLQTAQSGSLNRLVSKSQTTPKVNTVIDIMSESTTDNDSLYDNDNDMNAQMCSTRLYPSQEAIGTNTENITKMISELLTVARESKHESYITCSDNITRAVDKMIDLFPLGLDDQAIQSSLSKLKSGAMQLNQVVKSVTPEVNGQPDYGNKTKQIIQCAFNIAKAAKTLVVSVNSTHPA